MSLDPRQEGDCLMPDEITAYKLQLDTDCDMLASGLERDLRIRRMPVILLARDLHEIAHNGPPMESACQHLAQGSGLLKL